MFKKTAQLARDGFPNLNLLFRFDIDTPCSCGRCEDQIKCFKRICLCQIHVFVCYIVVTHNVDLNMIGGCWSLLIRKGKIRTCPPRLICRLRPAAFFRRSQIAEPAEYTWPALSTTCCPPLPPPVLMTNYIFWSFFFCKFSRLSVGISQPPSCNSTWCQNWENKRWGKA